MKRTMWLVAMACLASLPLTFIGCMSDEDLYDPAKAEARLKAEYAKKFVEKYGEITSDYSWDATSMKPRYASTRGEEPWYKVSSDWYEVDRTTRGWIRDNLPENQNNRGKGKSFVMTVPNNPFTLVPIYQGKASMRWSFHVQIEGLGEIKLWEKGENIQIKEGNEDWENLGDGEDTSNKEVRARKYTFDFTNTKYVGKVMDFYLQIESGVEHWAKEGTKQYSHNGMMLALNCDRPGNISEEKEVKIIGCEDANLEYSDWDLNDVVFLMYGEPEVPDVIEVIEGEYTRSVTKRYMIEDLGSTDDFDFNDVVVDVTEKSIIKYIEENGVIKGTTEKSKEQTATIRHLGGLLPFTLTIGNTSLPEMEGVMGVNPNKEFEIKGWIPEQNNISVTVKGTQNGEVHNVSFPEDGEIPMIIAVDPTVNWMEERVAITKEWFDGLKK